MMLENPLLIWGKLTNPGNGYRLWERPKTERELKKPKGYPSQRKVCGNRNWEAVWCGLTSLLPGPT